MVLFSNLDSEAFDFAERLTNILNIFSHNKVTNFVESACWPDDVKTVGLNSLDEWHFIDLPVRLGKIFQNNNLNITYKPDDALGTIVSKQKIKLACLFQNSFYMDSSRKRFL
jgi:hypothetical protein